tara:strand:- start:114 stop:488 length:375 start_codon:yes stop_codon:yes gene_type:complete
MSEQDKKDWSVHGMTEREMRSRIHSHREMAYKAAEVAVANKVPSAFFGKGFRTWAKNNPDAPFFTPVEKGGTGGYDALVKQAERHIGAHNRYVKRTNTALKLTKALEAKKAAKLKADLNKLIGG